ncbi:MAG: hypothetical protein AAGB01_01525 [Cyanobacteria bacterium P01_F01_bin.42]
MDKTKLANLQTQINSVQAQINHAVEEREALKAEYTEALKVVAKRVIELAVAEYGYEIVGPIHDVAKGLMEVFPLPPEEVKNAEVIDATEFETIPYYEPVVQNDG